MPALRVQIPQVASRTRSSHLSVSGKLQHGTGAQRYEKAKENAKNMEGKQAYEKDKTALKDSMADELKPYEKDVAAAEEKHEEKVEDVGHELMDKKAAASAKAERKVSSTLIAKGLARATNCSRLRKIAFNLKIWTSVFE